MRLKAERMAVLTHVESCKLDVLSSRYTLMTADSTFTFEDGYSKNRPERRRGRFLSCTGGSIQYFDKPFEIWPPPNVSSSPLKYLNLPIRQTVWLDLESWGKRQKTRFSGHSKLPLKVPKSLKNEVKIRIFGFPLYFHRMITTRKEHLWRSCFDPKKVWGPVQKFLRKSQKIDFFETPNIPFNGCKGIYSL